MNMQKKILAFTGLGFELVGLVLGAILIGQKSEEWMPSNGLLLSLFIFLALIIWIFHVFVLLKRLS